MRLHKIRLAGFKSFVDVTNIPFPDNMTAIVGPNGCGKSNVIDAVRWVLGESSAKNLRGDAMTDVIFNGSSARKPVSQCSVELVFDNTSGRVQGEYAKYNELSVKRVVNREAQSLYYLNGTKCRRRDITDIFLGTGLGPRSYAIIEQGMISRLIESKPQELRVFIEEAAGISKYKERRRETENRIRHTRENLDRLQDVRSELAQQLDKLKRQAAAATRYTTLKARERTLKGELATVRWIKHSEQVVAFEAQIKQQETDIEVFIAEQRGSEKSRAIYYEKQQDLTQTLQDLQSQLYKIGSEISRLQQDQLHTTQRKNRINQDIQQLQQSLDEAVSHHEIQREKAAELTAQIDGLTPELAMADEQQEQSQMLVLDAEEAHETLLNSLREQEQHYHNIKQQIETRKSQLQSIRQIAQRSQVRIDQIKQSLVAINVSEQADQIAIIEAQVMDVNLILDKQAEKHEAACQRHQKLTDDVASSEEKLANYVGQLQTAEAELTAVETLIDQNSNPLQAHLDNQSVEYQLIWAYLDVPERWQKAVETVLGYFGGSCVVNDATLHTADLAGQSWFKGAMSDNKKQGTLGSMIRNSAHPSCLDAVECVETLEEALSQRANLTSGLSLITPQGHWLGVDFTVFPQQGEQHTGDLELHTRKQRLLSDIDNMRREKETLRDTLHSQKQAVGDAEGEKQATQTAHFEAKSQLQQLTITLEHERQLLANAEETAQSYRDELEVLTAQVEEEAIEAETIEESLEAAYETLEAAHQTQDDHEAARQQSATQMQQARLQHQSSKDAYHQLALQLAALETQLKSLAASEAREQEQVIALRERQDILLEEREMLEEPDVNHEELLESLMEEKLAIEAQQVTLNTELAEVDVWLNDVEKGQQSVQQKVDAMRSELERNKLDCEGQRIRANSILEQLTELGQNLKTVLETLPDDANEPQWQSELEQVQRGVSRLGAVNLAAVEEFEQQSERKAHLDTQFDDLTDALETLEAAIRKIDKETRSRFKATFEQVNGDLKMLFPKVFGGGAAYLDLTDNDLLETGVTIMARPPGKKNSTIHLLSGGEKALTALSLVFAIFRLNPAPFCLLDEVDAPLDDANVGRFCKLVTEMSQTVQFIYITHNKIAMEMANHLTGVTMAEPGVSRMVSVTVDEAASMVEE